MSRHMRGLYDHKLVNYGIDTKPSTALGTSRSFSSKITTGRIKKQKKKRPRTVSDVSKLQNRNYGSSPRERRSSPVELYTGNPELAILNSILLREDYIARLKRDLQAWSGPFGGDAAELEGYALPSISLLEVSDSLHRIRLVTVDIVEGIQEWRKTIHGSADNRIPYTHEGVNYMQKMCSDLDFVDVIEPVVEHLGHRMRRNPCITPGGLDHPEVSSANADSSETIQLFDRARIMRVEAALLMEESAYGACLSPSIPALEADAYARAAMERNMADETMKAAVYPKLARVILCTSLRLCFQRASEHPASSVDGILTYPQFVAALRKVTGFRLHEASDDHIEWLCGHLDPDRSGCILYEEFAAKVLEAQSLNLPGRVNSAKTVTKCGDNSLKPLHTLKTEMEERIFDLSRKRDILLKENDESEVATALLINDSTTNNTRGSRHIEFSVAQKAAFARKIEALEKWQVELRARIKHIDVKIEEERDVYRAEKALRDRRAAVKEAQRSAQEEEAMRLQEAAN